MPDLLIVMLGGVAASVILGVLVKLALRRFLPAALDVQNERKDIAVTIFVGVALIVPLTAILDLSGFWNGVLFGVCLVIASDAYGVWTALRGSSTRSDESLTSASGD